MLPIKTLISTVLLITKTLAAVNTAASNNVALYWGQNGAGGQDRLSTYCANSDVDIVVLSFLNDFPDPLNVNFANQCGDTFADGLLNCAQIGQDIQTCQAEGKTVLLSLGGAYGNYGFTSTDQVQAFADTLWNKFGAGSDPERPFGNATVDGFDFDIEQGSNVGYTELAQDLRTLYATDSSKTYYLSASPQCPFPDPYVGDALAAADFDFAFIQFYNNDCSLDGTFNYDTWSTFAPTSGNSNLKLFVGLPADPTVAGYADPATIEAALELIKCDPTLAGISIWDASGAWLNVDSNGDNFVVQVKDILNAEQCPAPSSSSSSPSSSSSSVVSSSTAAVVASSSIFYGNVSSSAAPLTTETYTVSDLITTVVTITSCSENKCHETPYTTVVTDVQTLYTTYCPESGKEEETTPTVAPEVVASTSSEAAVIATKVSSGVPEVAPQETSTTVAAVESPVVTLVPVVSAQVEGSETEYVTVNIYSTISAAGNGSAPAEVPTYEAAGSSISIAWSLAIPLAVAALL